MANLLNLVLPDLKMWLVDTDISKEQDYADWDDFEQEPVEKLEDIIM